MSTAPDRQSTANPAPRGNADGASGWFDYGTAFSRNLGWLTDQEQARLRRSRIAIAGMGGVGGIHMLTLARMGVGNFSIADMDRFELVNFNRQMGASLRTLGKPKVHSVLMLAREINPEIDARVFDEGVTEDNLDAFLDGCDAYIDGLDFFVLDIRRKLFARARERGIPAITAGPLGFGTGFIIFTPDGMSFEDYFRFEGCTPEQQYLRFLFGLTPWPRHMRYLGDRARVDMDNKRGPSTAAACQLCAGVAATQAVKLIIGRGKVWPAPHYHQFDPFDDRYLRGRLRWGNAGPVQQVKLFLADRLMKHWKRAARAPEREIDADVPFMERLLEAARWAPSPDNSQPWRFEVTGPLSLTVRIDRETGNPYQYRTAEPNMLAVGMLVEALALSASQHGFALDWSLADSDRLMITLHRKAGLLADPLAQQLVARSVDRGAYRRTPLTRADKDALAQALGPGYRLHWIESQWDRLRLGRVNAAATRVRLRSPACHAVHEKIIDWASDNSETGLPARAIGIDPLARWLMRWAMASWPRMDLVNRLGAPLYAALEMDVRPAWASAAFVQIEPLAAVDSDARRIGAGRAVMRLWLEATARGLALQPALAPLWLAAQGDAATASGLEPALAAASAEIAAEFQCATGNVPTKILFQARLGYAKGGKAKPRSVRRPLGQLLATGTAKP